MPRVKPPLLPPVYLIGLTLLEAHVPYQAHTQQEDEPPQHGLPYFGSALSHPKASQWIVSLSRFKKSLTVFRSPAHKAVNGGREHSTEPRPDQGILRDHVR